MSQRCGRQLTLRVVWRNVNPLARVKTMDMQGHATRRIVPAMSERLEEIVRKDFGKLLKAARKAKGYTQASKLAMDLKVEPARYRYWERGQAMPDLGTLVRICRQLG